MAAWFAKSGGNNLNSGGGYADGPDINGDSGTPFVIAGGTGGTYAPGGLNALPVDSATYTRSLNLVIGGVETIRKITVNSDTTFTLAAAVTDGSYNGRIGGARATVLKAASNATGNNVALAANDTVSVEPLPQVWTENNVTYATVGIVLRGNDAPCRISGTGGAGGSDILVGDAITLDQVELVNAVDRGHHRTGSTGGVVSRSKILNCGGAGLSLAGAQLWHVEIAGCATGLVESFNSIAYLHVHDITGVGVFTTQPQNNFAAIRFSIFANNGDHGLALATNNARVYHVENCLFLGNSKSGISYTANYPAAGPHLSNCSFVNNDRYGMESAALTFFVQRWFGHNLHFHGNTLGKYLNVPQFQGEIEGDPEFVDEAGGDYTLATGSPLIGAGFSPFESPMAMNIGPTIAEVSTAGGSGFAGGSLLNRGFN